MNPKKLYKHLYRLLDDATPIKADCGKLCGSACCDGDEDTGMYLFPFEEVMYSGKERWLKIYDSDFFVGGNAVKIAICNGRCEREKRPLSCRIFPLFLYSGGELKADFRAKHICPLAAANIETDEYNPQFTKNVRKVFNILKKFSQTSAYIKETEKIILEQKEISDLFI